MPAPIEHGTAGKKPVFYNVLVPGTVVDRRVDSSGIHVRVAHSSKNGAVSAWLPVLQRSAVGTQTLFCPRKSDLCWALYDPTGIERGVVIGTSYTTNLPPPSSSSPDSTYILWDDGSWFEFSPDAKKLTLNTQGEIDISCVGDLIAVVQGKLTATVTGDATVTTSGNAVVQASGNAKLKGATVTLDGPVTITQTLVVTGDLTVNGATTTVQNINIAGTESGGGST